MIEGSRKRKSSDEPCFENKMANNEFFSTLCVHVSKQGEREEMQDSHVLLPIFNISPDIHKFLKRSSFLAIFDGHAGSRAADYCKNHIVDILRCHLKKYPEINALKKCLKSSFFETYKQVDEEFLKQAKASKPFWKDGTTATTMLILDNTVYVANVGDSKVVVARQKEDGTITPVCLTVDHNPMAHSERMRIQNAGAVVKDGRINGIIEVSRSIGDASFKSLGIISTPDLKKLTLTTNDLFAIIACDGLWKSFSNLEAIMFVKEEMENIKNIDLQLQVNENREECELRVIANKLASEAVRRKCGDNVSVILIKINII